ncbi:response regulator [Candidatus Bipolaricaulota bacterium]|nr:response regulator [Candidatus Bipolaricaulota bacterium]
MTRTILIADDDKKSIKLLRDVLQASGYSVAVARDGRETVALAQEQKPDLILMDIRMPVMDGIAAMKELRADPNTDRIPIIAITAHAMRGDKESFIQQGFDDFLAKPVDIHVLLDRVRLHLHEEE